MQLFTNKLFQKLKTQHFIPLFIALLLAISTSATLAGDAAPNELKEQQQKLQEILDKIGDAQEQRAEQKALLERLRQKMQCNWDLIQDYDACDKKYKEQKLEQLSCSQKAKERARGCLSEVGE
jgi:ABC-type phosphate transport system auxiliary subunit